MDSNSSNLSLLSLNELLEKQKNSLDRGDWLYEENMTQIADLLNRLGRGTLKGLNIDELRAQTGYLLYFMIQGTGQQVPFDVEYVGLLKCHYRNPTILVLRRIRKFLMVSHRRALALLEDNQNRERLIHFDGLDIDRKVKANLNEMQRFQTMAQLTPSVGRKLDILTRAVCVPRKSKREFRLLNGMLADEHHLRNEQGMSWLKRSTCKGDKVFMNRVIEKGMWILDRKSERLREELQKLCGLPFGENNRIVEGGDWYSLTSPVHRGEDFISIFNTEEHLESEIKHVTFFVVQSAYHADKFQRQLDDLSCTAEPAAQVASLSSTYFELERCIDESGRSDGEATAAVSSDIKFNLLSLHEAKEATAWIQTNRMKLQSLKMETFARLFKLRRGNPSLALPAEIENQIHAEKELLGSEPGDEILADVLPRIPIRAMEAELELLEVEDAKDGNLLQAICDFHKKVVAWRQHLNDLRYHRKLRDLADDFDEYEQHLLRFYRLEEALEKMRMRCEQLLEKIYHSVYLGDIPPSTVSMAFEVVLDHILHRIRLLEYEVIDVDRYQRIFERAVALNGPAAYVQLGELFKELHALPRQSQLIQALAGWEHDLDHDTWLEKQNFIVENEYLMQELIDQVRAELRERMVECPIQSKRLRFDVFSLSDCYAENLETSLDAVLRSSSRVASEVEGEALLEYLQALEGQVIEAQRVTRPKGEAIRKLRDLERSKLMPTTFLEDLRNDLDDNFQSLDHLLVRINAELVKVRCMQNRFGGDHDTELFSLTINLFDLEQLKKIYNFVENITMMDLKRFGLVYNHKNGMLDDLLKRAVIDDPSVPDNIAVLVNRRIFKAFKESKNIPLDLKILILIELPEILESECELLLRTINFVHHSKVSSKAIYQALLQVLGKAAGADIVTQEYLRELWGHFSSQINDYNAKHYKQNFELNRRMLLADSQQIISDHLE